MFQKSQIPEFGKFKITKSTATSVGRSGLSNKAGIDIRAYNMMLRGNLASSVTRGGTNDI